MGLRIVDAIVVAPVLVPAVSAINAYMEKLRTLSDFLVSVNYFFTNSSLVFNNTHYNLWPYIAWLPQGATLLPPTDAAWALPMPMLAMDMLTLIPEKSQVAWTANLGLYMTILTPYISDQWQVNAAPVIGAPS